MMSYRSQRSSRRSTGRGRGKVHHKKSEKKTRKRHSGNNHLFRANKTLCLEEVADRIIERLGNLGVQTFAFFPFSQYFEDWFLSLKSVVSEFESNSNVKVDEKFLKARSQLLAAIELRLSERKSKEAVVENAIRRLAKQRSLLVQTDTEYSYAKQELVSERKSEIRELTRKIRPLEEDLKKVNHEKVGILNPIARRSKSRKKSELTRKLKLAKSELESIKKEIEAKQKKLAGAYEKKKQALIKEVQSLEKTGSSVTDGSVEDRRVVCEKLKMAVKTLLERNRSLQ